LKSETPLNTASSNQLIDIYKTILSIFLFDEEIVEKLGREYQRRGWSIGRYRSIHHWQKRYTQRGEYRKAIKALMSRYVKLKSAVFTVRQACAELYCRIGDQKQRGEPV